MNNFSKFILIFFFLLFFFQNQVLGQGILDKPELLSPFYDPSKPEEIPVIEPPNFLIQWKSVAGANSYFYEILEADTVIISGDTINTAVFFGNFLEILDIGDIYDWRVMPCLDSEGNDCQEESWSDKWKFRTPYPIPPTIDESDSGPANGAENVLIPVILNWDDMPYAVSYDYEVFSTSDFSNIMYEGTVEDSKASFDYPDVKPSTMYWWRVKTCIFEQNTVCGEWSETRNFTTFSIGKASEPSPGDGEDLLTYQYYISWSKVFGVKFYQYTIDYLSMASDETTESCDNLVGTKIIPPRTVSYNSVYPGLECLGEYQWSVRACLDKNCQEAGDWSGPWTFTYVQPVPIGEGGIVPCGRKSDNPNTPWNERDYCEFKHLFLVVKNIIDFVLWRLGFIVLILLIIATFIVTNFSTGSSSALVQIKSLWKSAGQGYAIMFLAWMIINMILKLLGFTDTWWLLPF